MANDTNYRLAAGVFTRDISKTYRTSHGHEVPELYTQTKSVVVKL